MEIRENFISIDVETTGSAPGIHSMLEIGACNVFEPTNTFSASLEELEGATWSTSTRKFWMENSHNRQVLEKIQQKARPVVDVMYEFRDWISQWRKPILVSHPVTFDYSMIHWYWWKVFDNEPPFGWGGCDIKTLGMATLKIGFRESTKRTMKRMLPQGPWHHMKHTHIALDDALEQAALFRILMEKI